MTWVAAALLIVILVTVAARARKNSRPIEVNQPQKTPSDESIAFVILARHDVNNRFRSRAIQREIAADAAKVKREIDQIPNVTNPGAGSMNESGNG